MKVKAKVLSPVHIRKERYLKDFSFIQDKDVYIFDEFECFEFLSRGDIEKIKNNAKRVIKSNVEIEKNEVYTFMDYFDLEENRYRVYIPASSIKGAIRIAYENFLRGNINDKFQKIILKDIKDDFETKIYKSINIKICKNAQTNRKKRVKELMQYVECLIPNQEFEFEIEFRDKYLERHFVKNMNNFYFDKYLDDIKKAKTCKQNIECENCIEKDGYLECELYFYNASLPEFDKNRLIQENKFLLNLGHFGGAVKKSLDEKRKITSKCGKESKYTTTKTYALEKDGHLPYFEKELLPFGWILCEIME